AAMAAQSADAALDEAAASRGDPASPSTNAPAKIALLSTRMVLERKFRLLEDAARAQGVALAWVRVDVEGDPGVARALDGAAFVLIDAPRTDDQALVERVAG